MECVRSSEFLYTVDELREAWAIREETFDLYFAFVQWAKKRDVLDDCTTLSMMRSILEGMEKIAHENNCYSFDEVNELYTKKWMNFVVKPKE